MKSSHQPAVHGTPPPPEPASTEALGEQIAELAAHLTAATHRMLVLLREFDERNGWEGFRTCAHWLSWRLGIDLGAARERVRVARTLAELPVLSEAMRRGEVSFSKVRALTRVATPATESNLLSIAKAASARHIERLVRAWRRCDRIAELEEANAKHRLRSVKVHHEDGMLVLRARLDPEVGEVLLRALEAAEDEIYRRRDGESSGAEVDESREQMRADALAAVAEAALGHGLGPVEDEKQEAETPENGEPEDEEPRESRTRPGRHRTADHYQVVVHVEEGEGSLENGERVSAETWRRIACDAGLVAMLRDADGETLSVGRKTRSIPPSMRRALDRRDACCQFPGCGSRRCDAHHIRHWADGGETKLENIVKLCRRHHRMVHEEGYTVARRGDGELAFRRPDGRALDAAPALPWLSDDPVAELTDAHREEGLAIGPKSLETWNGDRFEMGPAVSHFLAVAAEERAARVSAETPSGASLVS